MPNFDFTVLLVAKDLASKTIGKVGKQIGGLNKISRTASVGMATLATNVGRLGVVAAAGIGVAVKQGIASLAELESAVASADGAIKQMGLTGQVTGRQIAGWANEIEANIGAAFDDKAITQATSTLIRFGKLTPDNIRPAMEIIADLATKTGDVGSAATLLAKALADPEKAAGKLARSGIILTKAEQAQIKAFTEAGDAAAAQKVILDSLAKTTRGAALASQGPYARAMSVLRDVTEDAQRALAEGFLPVLEKLAGKLSAVMADPKAVASIREFGKGLASGLDSLISIAEKLPWGTIGTSLQIAGAGAKAVLGAFVSLPPWVQTAVLTGWGLNKLTGGALGSIVGQLASGLVKGVLGINAGVVNLRAASVVGGGVGGGAAGAAGAAGKGAGVLGTVSKVFVTAFAASAAIMLAGELAKQSEALREQGKGVTDQTKRFVTDPKTDTTAIVNAIKNIDEQFADPLSALALGITNPLNGVGDELTKTRATLVGGLLREAAAFHQFDSRMTSVQGAVNTVGAKVYTGYSTLNAITQSGFLRTVSASNAAAQAIRDKDLSVTVNLPRPSITVRQLTRAVAVGINYNGKLSQNYAP